MKRGMKRRRLAAAVLCAILLFSNAGMRFVYAAEGAEKAFEAAGETQTEQTAETADGSEAERGQETEEEQTSALMEESQEEQTSESMEESRGEQTLESEEGLSSAAEEETEEEQPAETVTASETESTAESEGESEETLPTETEDAEEETEETSASSDEMAVMEEEESIVISEFVPNPLYEGIVDRAELEAEVEALCREAAQREESGIQSVDSAGEVYTSEADAAAYVREQMKQRENTIVVSVPKSMYTANSGVAKSIAAKAMEHTESSGPKEGDSLRWVYGGYNCNITMPGTDSGTGTLTYTFTYYTTYAQEQELDGAVASAMSDMSLEQKTEYEKILTIYDYICDHTDYDYANLDVESNKTKYTAYAALCQGKAVCQGYAVLFYRMCLEAGLSARVISGDGGGPHAWNIVRLGSVYYNLDCTWDGQDQVTTHNWFLLSGADFGNHTRDSEYDTAEFNGKYPMATSSYGAKAEEGEVPTGELPKIDMTPADGNVVMEFSGSYFTETAEKILKRLNDIRWEACKQGIKDPATGRSLTEADYKPLKWSSDLEAIARLRAAEATVAQSHTRPNGAGCFSVRTENGEQSWAENLAWNYSGLMEGIEQWYGEKADWVKQTQGKVTGHYQSLISTRYQYVGVGAFRLTSGGWYSVAQEFSSRSSMEEVKSTEQGKVLQPMEVKGSAVTKLAFGKSAVTVEEGGSVSLSLKVTADYPDYYGTKKTYTGAFRTGGDWTSSDETVAVVDGSGNVTAKKSGSADIAVKAGGKSAAAKVLVYAEGEEPFWLQRPAKTTYKVGQKLDVKGGTVTYVSDGNVKTQTLTAKMVSGFDSANPGVRTLTVTCAGYSAAYDVLIVEEPVLEVRDVTRLSEVPLPSDVNGSYSWKEPEQEIGGAGEYTFGAVYTPADTQAFQELTDLEILVIVQRSLEENLEIAFKRNAFSYNGTEQEPKVVVTVSGVVLTEGKDYELSYRDHKNAGTATVTVSGLRLYYGSGEAQFQIEPAKLIVRAKDKALLLEEKVPAAYEYEIVGLMPGDALAVEPSFTCDVTDTGAAGKYAIVPYGADAGANYEITYENGTLFVAEERFSYTVSFDLQGHGQPVPDYVGVKAGSTIAAPDGIQAPGYRFDGWYRDAACTKAWNFDADIVQADTVLYAKWLRESGDAEFYLQAIPDMIYTGKACKPAFSVYDGETLLKLNRDYTVKYVNNIHANAGGARAEEGVFQENLPYVIIAGKGNYRDTVKVNFNILPAVLGYGGEEGAPGVTLKYTAQAVQSLSKSMKPFGSIRLSRAMKQGTDFTLTLTVVNARDAAGRNVGRETVLEGGVIPAGYEGEFLLEITGTGDYTGSIRKTVEVADKAHLMKNAQITLGKKIKTVIFEGRAVELPAAEIASEDCFIVKSGKVVLIPNRDYTVSYRNNDRVGKAELIVTGMGEYAGSKSVFFTIKGQTFSAKTVSVEVPENKIYTGTALTQNDIALVYGAGTEQERELVYGTDYTISYGKNIGKGTASMTFKGMESAGFSGSFKKTFRIAPADISLPALVTQAEDMARIVAAYSRAGAKPAEEVVLTNAQGAVLKNGRDYTLSYKNNKAVASPADEKPPLIVIKGKGNYTGVLEVPFTIERAALDSGNIGKVSAVEYKGNKAEDYAYKPAVRIMDGKQTLRAGQDYEIEYKNNTQAAYEKWISALMEQEEENPGDGLPEEERPRVIISEKADSAYTVPEPIVIPLPVYRAKLTKGKLRVSVDEAVYTGAQVMPRVKVFYIDGDEERLLEEGKEYSLSYGANVGSGGKKGTVKVSGISPYYGGEVTVKFDIQKKQISF